MYKSFFCAALLLASVGCSERADVKNVKQASAKILPAKDSKVTGKVTFTQVDGGVKIVADVDGLKEGDHGFHIHEKGDCSASDFSSAGGHFNPTNQKHGGPDSAERHVGDFGNLTADANGHAHYERVDKLIQLNGVDTIIGRSIMVHEGADDLTTQPTGNSAGRLGCGLIQAD